MAVDSLDLIKTWVVIIAFQALKTLFLAARTGTLRGKHKNYLAKEDVATLGQGQGQVVGPAAAAVQEHEEVTRWNSAHRNELENLPPFLGVSLAFIFTALYASKGSATRDPTAGIILFTVYAASRAAYTAAYIHGHQPHRTYSYLLGVLCQFVIGFYAIVNVFVNTPSGNNSGSGGN